MGMQLFFHSRLRHLSLPVSAIRAPFPNLQPEGGSLFGGRSVLRPPVPGVVVCGAVGVGVVVASCSAR